MSALTGFVVGTEKSTISYFTATLASLASYLEIFNSSPDSSDTLCRDSHVPVVITLSSKSCNCYRSSPLSSRTKTIALTGFVVGIVKSITHYRL
ncbi:hypothetical protein AVEN_40243-1 [Araneus ventricosus]|uniref:Uncharacterized protein n=1 Tax=Araneus ventricosus TaxID=182803 RepID=A0A4Y2JED5_ARAVE|nr:hypothetical protein AVEN_40243-1 [Araneus ventricosus]